MPRKIVRSGYEIYNKKAKSSKKRNPLDDSFPPLPKTKYAVIYVDPPWDYGGKMQYDRSCTKKHNPDFLKDVFISSAEFQYPTLRLAELCELDVPGIAAEDCLMFMWTSSPHLAQAIALGTSWGFAYRTVAFIWNKMVHNPGIYTMSYCEMCLVFKKGKIPSPRGARNIKQLVEEPRQKHSQKPEEVRRRIELMFPRQKKIELFARLPHKRWDTWGLDVFARKALLEQQGLKLAVKV